MPNGIGIQNVLKIQINFCVIFIISLNSLTDITAVIWLKEKDNIFENRISLLLKDTFYFVVS